MPLKAFFSSKLNWLGMIQVAIGVLQLASNIQHITVQTLILLVSGALTIILRTFFTSQPITEFAANGTNATS